MYNPEIQHVPTPEQMLMMYDDDVNILEDHIRKNNLAFTTESTDLAVMINNIRIKTGFTFDSEPIRERIMDELDAGLTNQEEIENNVAARMSTNPRQVNTAETIH
jgi:hypothetical protein